MIIVSITGPDMVGALRQITRSSPYADLFEFRIDCIAGFDIGRLLHAVRKPVIATCRPAWEGGRFRGPEGARLCILLNAALLGAKYVDIEWKARELLALFRQKQLRGTRIIVSRHFQTASPIDETRCYRELCATGADVVKFAFVPRDISEMRRVIRFLALAKRDRQKAIAVAMGDAGEVSRTLYRKFGGWATYASAEEGPAAAPGQIPASMLKNVYRADRLSPSTRVYGVVGNPLTQSKGIYLHNRLFGSARKVYCRFRVSDLSGFMRTCAPFLAGFSVTIPYKEEIIRYLDGTDATAAAIGAVNTVIRKGGKLLGMNSDAPGALDAIEAVARVRGKTLLVVGAGGAARAIVYEARRRGARVLVTNRTAARGRRIAREFDVQYVPLSQIAQKGVEILVNATSVGMSPRSERSPVPPAITARKIVFDAVYNPPVTRLLRDARRHGSRVISGMEMYLNQAAMQSTLFAGRKPAIAAMRRILAPYIH